MGIITVDEKRLLKTALDNFIRYRETGLIAVLCPYFSDSTVEHYRVQVFRQLYINKLLLKEIFIKNDDNSFYIGVEHNVCKMKNKITLKLGDDFKLHCNITGNKINILEEIIDEDYR